MDVRLIWILLPLITAAGSALLVFYILQARLEAVVAKEREALVEARATMKTHEREVEDRVRAAEEETRRKAFDEFMADIHVEERHYMRENKSLFSNTKSMVLQERLYFRNLPLSNWVEHELTVEHGQTADLANLARAASVFASQNVVGAGDPGALVAAQVQAAAQMQQAAAQMQMAQAAMQSGPPRTQGSFGVPRPGQNFGARPAAQPFAQSFEEAPRNTQAAPTAAKVTSIAGEPKPLGGPMALTPRLAASRGIRG